MNCAGAQTKVRYRFPSITIQIEMAKNGMKVTHRTPSRLQSISSRRLRRKMLVEWVSSTTRRVSLNHRGLSHALHPVPVEATLRAM